MSGLYAVAVTVCAAALAVTLLSRFVTDGGTQTLLRLVLGAFVLCSMLLPLGRAVQGISADIAAVQSATVDSAAQREQAQRAVLERTKAGLEQTLCDILAQNGRTVKNASVTLAIQGENRVIIADVTLTVGDITPEEEKELVRLTQTHFAVEPQIVRESE